MLASLGKVMFLGHWQVAGELKGPSLHRWEGPHTAKSIGVCVSKFRVDHCQLMLAVMSSFIGYFFVVVGGSAAAHALFFHPTPGDTPLASAHTDKAVSSYLPSA